MGDPRKCLLLVEDDAVVAMSEAHRLESIGYAVIHVSSGEEAVGLLRGAGDKVDLVLMDVDLGRGMDGPETAQVMLQERELPIVFLSSHSERAIVEKTERIRSYGFVTKDSGIVILDASIKTAFKLFEALCREKEGESALREREEQLSLAIEGSGAGLWDWRIDTGEMVINDRWASVLGYSKAELTPVDFKTFAAMTHPDDLKRSDQVTADYFAGRIKSHTLEIRMRHKDGHWVTLLDRGMVTEWDKDGKPLRMTGMHFDISDRARAEEALQQLVRQKEVFIRELHHRIKNNLSVVSSLLDMQAPLLKDDGAREVFRNAVMRIRSISLVHEKLMVSGGLELVELGPYLDDLARSVFAAMAADSGTVQLKTSFVELGLETEKAIPLGIIVNELLTNSLKYGFPSGREGSVRLDLGKGGASATLLISDDGIGLPSGFGTAGSKGLGLNLVRLLVQQIDGSLNIGKGPGASFAISFPIGKPA
jgi:PAS domain S-box-containing protein